MEYDLLRPHAVAIVSSLRSIGYSFNTAIADLIDNSISADATLIDISFRAQEDVYVAILDNGRGMSRATLVSAMRFGGNGPGTVRGKEDLGRYGLGLKTASLSQCRQLTVVTLRAGSLSAARWDLDEIISKDDWVLQTPQEREMRKQPLVDELLKVGHGTVVIWRNFDLGLAGETLKASALESLVDDSRAHIGLTFQRFIDPQYSEKPITVRINNDLVAAIDPFMTSNPRTQQLPQEKVHIGDDIVLITPYILPHLKSITKAELEKAGGITSLRYNQGFYVYRHSRLIIYGTWFQLLRQNELHKLVRISLEIPNTMDELWGLDVKKSAAKPPYAVRKVLLRIINRVAESGANVIREKKRRGADLQVVRLWERLTTRDGVTYRINRSHPAVTDITSTESPGHASRVELLLKSLELTIPAASIYADIAQDTSLDRTANEIKTDLITILAPALAKIDNNPLELEKLSRALCVVDPFAKYPLLTKEIIREIENGQ